MKRLVINSFFIFYVCNLSAQSNTASLEYGRGLNNIEAVHYSILKERDTRMNFGVEASGIANWAMLKEENRNHFFIGPVMSLQTVQKRNFKMILALSVKGTYENEIFLVAPETFLRQYMDLSQIFRFHLSERLAYFPSKYIRKFFPMLAAGLTLSF